MLLPWGWSACGCRLTLTLAAANRLPKCSNQRCDEVQIRIRQRLNFKRFQQIRNLTNVLGAVLSNANSWKNPWIDFICIESRDKPVFSQIQLITQTAVIEYAT